MVSLPTVTALFQFFSRLVNAFPPQGAMDEKKYVLIKLFSFSQEVQLIEYTKTHGKKHSRIFCCFPTPHCVQNRQKTRLDKLATTCFILN